MLNTYETLIDKFTTYASSSSNVLAAFMFGSYARIEQPADEYSDIDIIMAVEDPEFFLTTDDWIKQIGKHRISFIEHLPFGEKVRRILFEDAMNIDFLIISKANIEKAFKSNVIVSFFGKGYIVLVDKNELSKYVSKELIADKPHVLISDFEFINLINDFWFHAVWATKKLMRGELWAARYCVDTYMKGLLLKLMENHARVINGMHYNTWYSGRFIDTWADKQVLDELKYAFSYYDRDDIIRALKVTMNMFRWMAIEVAKKLDYEYPYAVENSATEWMHQMINDI